MSFEKNGVNSVKLKKQLSLTRPLFLFPSNPFFKSSNFQLGDKDLKPRTRSWRVLQILATNNLAVWIGLVILFWLGLSSLNNLSIVFLPVLLLVITTAYLNLYHRPRKKSSTQP